MKGFSIATNEWGIHAILYKGYAAEDSAAWLSSLQEAADRMKCRGRTWGVFLDLRDLGQGAVSAAQTQALFSLLVKTGAGRSAVIASDHAAAAMSAAMRSCDAAHTTRIVGSDGRDRFSIAAAYKWVLNGTEPAGGALAGPATATAGMVVPFGKQRPSPTDAAAADRTAAPAATFRKAS